MSQRFAALSGYQIMWVWALFDLPVLTSAERKRATRFRNDLLDLGFEVVQFSVYTKYCASRERAEAVAKLVGGMAPEAGKVDILFFTDKQFEMIRSFRGKAGSEKPEKPAQMSFF